MATLTLRLGDDDRVAKLLAARAAKPLPKRPTTSRRKVTTDLQQHASAQPASGRDTTIADAGDSYRPRQARHNAALMLLSRWTERWPATFTQPPRPLAIGIDHNAMKGRTTPDVRSEEVGPFRRHT
jgi:hypothetical protein